MLGGLLAACRPPLAHDPVAVYRVNFDRPPAVQELRGGALPGGRGSWICFRSADSPVLTNAERYRTTDPREPAAAFRDLCPDEALSRPESLIALEQRDMAPGSGKVLLVAQDRYFFRSWKGAPAD